MLKVSTFYKFARVADPAALRGAVRDICERRGVRGTIIIAPEGINATVSGAGESLSALIGWLRADARFADLQTKESLAPEHPFKRLKALVKPEIVALGAPEAYTAARTGAHVAPVDWNALIADPDVTLIDARNAYEARIGAFVGALDPGTRAFNEFPAFVARRLDPARHRRVAMYCTGGIRCEKASSHMLARGFEAVYQLDGGVLKYLEVMPEAESLWRGECFVFDDRVSLGHGLRPGAHARCGGCGDPIPAAGTRPACPRCAGIGRSDPSQTLQSSQPRPDGL